MYFQFQNYISRTISLSLLLISVVWADKSHNVNPKSAIETLTEIAESGNASAQLKLGSTYFTGSMGATKDYDKAVYWFSQAAKGNHPEAQYSLGLCYEYGFGIDQDLSYALTLYQSSADQGHTLAQSNAGMVLKRLKRYDEAANYFLLAAKNNDVVAMREYGRMSILGLVTNKLPSDALIFLEPLAQRGDPEAQLLLVDYYSGSHSGESRDTGKMINYLWEAASVGLAPAQSKLGFCFEEGMGVTKDTSIAVKWYQKAADQNYPQAIVNLGNCYATGSGISMNKKFACQLYLRAAELEFAEGYYNLAVCYANGFGVEISENDAIVNFKKAANLANANAQYIVGTLFEEGRGQIDQNFETAFYWYKKSADQGHTQAIKAVGQCYLNGIGTEVNPVAAKNFLDEAAVLDPKKHP